MKTKTGFIQSGMLAGLFALAGCGGEEPKPPEPDVSGAPVEEPALIMAESRNKQPDLPDIFVHTTDAVSLSRRLDMLDFSNRVVRLTGSIDEDTANRLSRELQALSGIDPDTPITMIINSPGGHVSGGMWAIYDTIQTIDAPVDAFCYGRCASAGGFLFSTTTGKRSIAENAYIMLHESSGGVSQSARTSELKANMRKRLEQHGRQYEILTAKTGIPEDSWALALKDDFYVFADQAVEMGLADEVIKPKHNISPPKRTAGFPSEYCEKGSAYQFHPDFCK